ncbi:hypothetical protein [Plantactinospora sp. B5E13]
MNQPTRTAPRRRRRRVAVNGDLVGVITADRRTLVIAISRTN